MSLIVLKKIIEMFIILLVGVIIYKAKIINDVSTKHLSNVLLLLVSPLLIIQSYQIDFNRELLQGLIWAFAASFLTFLFMIVASEFLCHGDRNRSSVEKIAVSYSNSGFIGIPLISGVLGDKGVFYMTAYITVFNLLVCIPSSRQLKKYKIFVLPGVYRATFLCRQSLLFMKFHWC